MAWEEYGLMIELDRYLREEMPTRYELEDRKSLNQLETELNNMSLICEPRERASQASMAPPATAAERRQSAVATSTAGSQALDAAAFPIEDGSGSTPPQRQRRPTSSASNFAVIGCGERKGRHSSRASTSSLVRVPSSTSEAPRAEPAPPPTLLAIEEVDDVCSEGDRPSEAAPRTPDAKPTVSEESKGSVKPPAEETKAAKAAPAEEAKAAPAKVGSGTAASGEADVAPEDDEELPAHVVPSAYATPRTGSPSPQPRLRPQPIARGRQTSLRVRRQRETRFESAV